MSDQQVSVPVVVIFVLAIGLATRYLFFSPTSSSSSAAGRAGSGRRRDPTREAAAARAREAAAQTVQQMFPQVDRRTILWDLQRNGGNVQATSERILAGRMETPPVTFQPPPAPGSTPSGPQAVKRPERAQQPDLITRYHLQDKLSPSESESAVEDTAGSDGSKKREGWSSSKDERQALLKKRRDQMILEARRKMEAKIAAEKAGSS